MVISKYFIIFIIYSILGWVWESIYCAIKTKQWENRGFLYGPYCPIYGVGGAFITMLMQITSKTINFNLSVEHWWKIFLISIFGSIILEYTTSYVLEKLFNAKWWDYSDEPLNINGRICVIASIGFGFAGILMVYEISPFIILNVQKLPILSIELISLIMMAIFASDFALTISALTTLADTIKEMESNINTYMENVVESVNNPPLNTFGV